MIVCIHHTLDIRYFFIVFNSLLVVDFIIIINRSQTKGVLCTVRTMASIIATDIRFYTVRRTLFDGVIPGHYPGCGLHTTLALTKESCPLSFQADTAMRVLSAASSGCVAAK